MRNRQIKHQEKQLEQKVPDVKLREYLDALLQEVTELPEQQIVETEEIKEPSTHTQESVENKTANKTAATHVVESEVPESAVSKSIVESEHKPILESKKSIKANLDPILAENKVDDTHAIGKDHQLKTDEVNEVPTGIPPWAHEQFDCLLFDVAGLKLAAPLVCLGGIVQIESRLTQLFSQPDWMLGLLTNHYGKTRVVDTANWVMPEKYSPDMREDYQYIITINDSKWALACDHIVQSISLHTDEVRWRSKRTSRTWLAGTSTKQMCAILDVETLARDLNRCGEHVDDEKIRSEE